MSQSTESEQSPENDTANPTTAAASDDRTAPADVNGDSTGAAPSPRVENDGDDDTEAGSAGTASVSFTVPDDATDEEAAAIAAAIQAHLQDEQAQTDEQEAETGDPWTLSAQLLHAGQQPSNIPADVPADNWVAAARIP